MKLGFLMNRFMKKLFVLFAVVMMGVFGISTAIAAPPPTGFIVHTDAETGIESDIDTFVSLRYMRHIWTATDGTQATIVQQGTGTGLTLYSSSDDGETWDWNVNLSSDVSVLSDAVMVDDDLYVVVSTSSATTVDDVEFMHLVYDDATQTWSVDSQTPTTVYDSTSSSLASRATIASDSNDVLWTTFRLQDSSGKYSIRLLYSDDSGATWDDSGNVFTHVNAWPQKNAKVISTGTGIGVVYQDMYGGKGNPTRLKGWAYRDDSDSLTATMSDGIIAVMNDNSGDPYGSHWSVSADSNGDVHLSYQDNVIKYTKLDASAQTWSTPLTMSSYTGAYTSVSVTDDDDVYVFAAFHSGDHMWVKRYDSSTSMWSQWYKISQTGHSGMLRMASPEHASGLLPLLYQVNDTTPYELLHVLMDLAY